MDFVVTITSLGFVSGLEKSLIFFGNIKHNLAFSFLFRPTKFANWLDWTWQRLKSRFLYWLAVDQNTQGNIYNTDPLLKKKTKNKKQKQHTPVELDNDELRNADRGVELQSSELF